MGASATRRGFRHARGGTTIVEVAVVLPVFLTFVFGIIECSRIQMVSNVLKNACRQGARHGATEGVSSSDAIGRVNHILSSAVNPSVVDVIVKDASVYDTGGTLPETAADYQALPNVELDTVEPRELFLVRASVNYNDIALVPFPIFEGLVFTGQAFMRHE